MNTYEGFKVTESLGTEAQIERLRNEAIGIARATGSVGATCNESRLTSGEEVLVASVTVSRV
mgnify:CR=1 FL=1